MQIHQEHNLLARNLGLKYEIQVPISGCQMHCGPKLLIIGGPRLLPLYRATHGKMPLDQEDDRRTTVKCIHHECFLNLWIWKPISQ